jgi:uncharacterized protein GlcG (DUF336 family)
MIAVGEAFMKRAVLALATGTAVIAAPAAGQQIPGPYGDPITLERARAMVDAAHKAAQARGFRMAFAVSLPSGEPILLEVMDGTQAASTDVALAKARSAARFRRATKAFADSLAAGNLGALTLRDVVAVEGGLPITAGGRVIGALGVSGATAAEDGQIAAAALAAAR